MTNFNYFPTLGNQQNGYFFPQGFMFDLVSCPHYLGEILVYAGICMLMNFESSLLAIFLFILINQSFVALFNHRWYQKTFKEQYPKRRKAIFPYIL